MHLKIFRKVGHLKLVNVFSSGAICLFDTFLRKQLAELTMAYDMLSLILP